MRADSLITENIQSSETFSIPWDYWC